MAEPPKPGRPSSRTPEQTKLALKARSLGLDFATIADLLGVKVRTFERWAAGRADADVDFAAALRTAFATAKVSMARRLLKKAIDGNVASVIFWLKTRTTEFREVKPEAIDEGPARSVPRRIVWRARTPADSAQPATAADGT